MTVIGIGVIIPNTVGDLPNTVGDLPNTVGDLSNTVGDLPNAVGDLPFFLCFSWFSMILRDSVYPRFT